MQHNNTMTPVLKDSDCSQDFNLLNRRTMVSLGEQVPIRVICAGFPQRTFFLP